MNLLVYDFIGTFFIVDLKGDHAMSWVHERLRTFAMEIRQSSYA